jgi:hypothetical protein
MKVLLGTSKIPPELPTVDKLAPNVPVTESAARRRLLKGFLVGARSGS